MSERNIPYYSKVAEKLAAQYESVSFERVHADWHALIPDGGWALDVGAGSGRDAAHLADNNFSVVAVEPAQGMREVGNKIHVNSGIHWLDDRLPELKNVFALQIKFDLILLSAVWMHIPPGERKRAFRKLADLLNPRGKLIITLRHGSFPDERTAFPVSVDEIASFATQYGLILNKSKNLPTTDALGRDNIQWQTVVLTLPDDGSGAFPLLRHVTINERKSSTYKLGLLRSLLRIAEAHPGAVIERTDNWAEIPLGLLAYYWLKLYRPLIEDFAIQQSSQSNRGLGFVKLDGWHAISTLASNDVFLGAVIADKRLARGLTKTLKDIATTIKNMPAKYMTYPGTNEPIVEVSLNRVQLQDKIILDTEYLKSFGVVRVPTTIWDALSKFSVWIEPAIVNEWANLQTGYLLNRQQKLSEATSIAALKWYEPQHNTRLVRERATQLAKLERLYCVWSGNPLRQQTSYAIDHTLPFARWPNNDLWNLVPSKASLNRQKSDKLPSTRILIASRSDIIDWWIAAWADEAESFFIQARLALPQVKQTCGSFDDVFEALLIQKDRLRALQQLPEWSGSRFNC